jgi:hypothetical protein
MVLIFTQEDAKTAKADDTAGGKMPRDLLVARFTLVRVATLTAGAWLLSLS